MDTRAPRKQVEDLVVVPWTGVITNIPGHWDPEVARELITAFFSEFLPKNVVIFRKTAGKPYLQGFVQFRRDMHGYLSVQAFDKFFAEAGRGRRNWAALCLQEDVKVPEDCCSLPSSWPLYGWMASSEDLDADDDFGLSRYGALGTVAGMVEELVEERVKRELAVFRSRRAESQEMKANKDLMTLVTTLISDVNEIRESLCSRKSSADEDMEVATRALKEYGPCSGIAFRDVSQLEQALPGGLLKITERDSPRLQRLREDWGDEIYQKFMRTFCNAEGSHNVGENYTGSIAWNLVEDRKATLGEVIKGLEEVLELKTIMIRMRNAELASLLGTAECTKVQEEQTQQRLESAEQELRRHFPLVVQEDLEATGEQLEIAKRRLGNESAVICIVQEQVAESISLIRASREELQRKNSFIDQQALEVESLRAEVERKDDLIAAKNAVNEARRRNIEAKETLNKTLVHQLRLKEEELLKKNKWMKERGFDLDYEVHVKESEDIQPSELVEWAGRGATVLDVEGHNANTVLKRRRSA